LTEDRLARGQRSDTRAALAALPALPTTPATGSLALLECKLGQNETRPDTQGQTSQPTNEVKESDAKPCGVNEKDPLTTTVISGPVDRLS
jgi:hypothetical protein